MTLFGLKFNLNLSRKFIRLSRQEFLLWGTIAVFVLFFALTAWDGYLFYSVLVKERVKRADITSSSDIIKVKDIDTVIQLLDERQKKFEEILKSGTSTSSPRIK
jgi:hypothetical protein